MSKTEEILVLIHLLAKYDPVLREQLLRIQLGNKFATSYLSPTIQNEFIEILGEKSKMIKQVKKPSVDFVSDHKQIN